MISSSQILVFNRVRVEVLLPPIRRHLEDDRVVELPQVQAGQLFDLLQPVHQRVAVARTACARSPTHSGCFQRSCWMVNSVSWSSSIDRASLEHLFQEHLAHGGGQLIDQTGDTQIVIADDRLLSGEYLRHLQRHLGLLEGAGQIFDAGDHRADAHERADIELAGQRVDDRAGQLLDILGLDVGVDLLDDDRIGLRDVKDKVFLLVREQIDDHIVGRYLGLAHGAHQQHDAVCIGAKMQLSGLHVHVAGQNVIENDVLDKVVAVVLLVVILLDAGQRDGQQPGIAAGDLVGAGHENGVVAFLVGAKGLKGIGIFDKAVFQVGTGEIAALKDVADLLQLAAGDDVALVVNHADCAIVQAAV